MSGETKSLGQKDKLDKFYTKENTVKLCIDFLNRYLNLNGFQCIEPSAGTGAFLSYLDNYIAYDIDPCGERIKKANWFEVDKSQFKGKKIVIGNPPFGVQGQMAIKFFNESSFADYIAFILPRSFRKPSIQDRLNRNFHLIAELILPENSFLFLNEDYNVNCVFQIWEKRIEKRPIIKRKTTTNFFDFTKEKDKATCSIRRVGACAGKASFDTNYSEQSNYFLINKTELSDEEFVAFLNSLVHDRALDAVGPKSLSKSELIEDFETNYNLFLKEKER